MFKIFSNFIFFLILFFILIKICLLITEPNKQCSPGYKYSNLTLDCVNETKLEVNTLNCSDNQIREDKIECIEKNDAINIENQTQKNYFGVFFTKISSSAKQGIEDYDDKQLEEAIGKNCRNEYTLRCQNLLNLCAYELSKDEEERKYCNYVKNSVLNNRMFLDNIDRKLDVKYSLNTGLVNVANHNLNFWVAKYYFNGTLQLYERLEYDFLQCSNSKNEKEDFKFFGNNIESTCFIDITKYLKH